MDVSLGRGEMSGSGVSLGIRVLLAVGGMLGVAVTVRVWVSVAVSSGLVGVAPEQAASQAVINPVASLQGRYPRNALLLLI